MVNWTDEMNRYMTYVDKTLAAKPAEAGLGGVPSLQNKIRAFINVKYQKQGAWTNPRLEVSPTFIPPSCVVLMDVGTAGH